MCLDFIPKCFSLDIGDVLWCSHIVGDFSYITSRWSCLAIQMLKIAPTRSIPAKEINAVSILQIFLLLILFSFHDAKVRRKNRVRNNRLWIVKHLTHQQNRNAAIEEIDSRLYFSLFLLMCFKEIVYLCAW